MEIWIINSHSPRLILNKILCPVVDVLKLVFHILKCEYSVIWNIHTRRRPINDSLWQRIRRNCNASVKRCYLAFQFVTLIYNEQLPV
ncbi:hypothetical protein C464_17367 [Halorubrum coriense DSM 10284]|uniref:Uncharacterized protein n=1 Tax=Halorubrum coriense DSM 10284 TaxID=1227466 RepID=M0E823_9EURY|nr:hypothetical protein C464_17367 [Halorubrum coriense DSM 10284]